MRKIYFLLALFIHCGVYAQMNTWERFDYNDVDHPYKKDSSEALPPVDIYGNSWKLTKEAVLKMKGIDTTKYTNYPISPTSNSYNNFLSVSGDKVAFAHYYYGYVDGKYQCTNYLGFYNGSEMKFYPESSMVENLIASTEAFRQIRQTDKFVWITRNDKLIRFDKLNTFKIYASNESQLGGQLSYPEIFQNDSKSLILYNKENTYVFDDEKEEWKKLIPEDSTKRFEYSDSTKTLYIAGKKKIYTYRGETLQSFDVPELSTLGGYYPTIEEYSKDLFVVSYPKGFVLINKGKVIVKRFIDYSTTEYPFYFQFDERVPNPYLDNGILIFKYSGRSLETLYFSFYNDEVEFEAKYGDDRKDFFYKSLDRESYYFHPYSLVYDGVPQDLVIVKNNKDTTRIAFPKDISTIWPILADSNYVWIRSGDQNSSAKIWRMKLAQYFINGVVFYDQNKNGIQDVGEVGVGAYPLTIKPSGITVFPDVNGNFAFAGMPGEKYTMEIPADTLFNYTSKQLPYTFTNSEKNLIGITLANPIPEINTNFYLPWPRCGSIEKVALKVENTGFENIEKVKLVLVGDPLTEINSNEATSKRIDTLVFEVSNLSPRSFKSIPYEIEFPGGDKVGEVLNFKLLSQIYANGSIVSSTYDSINTIVRCSYDPNDKSVTPMGIGEEHLTPMNTTLSYLIRFENTGNDTAYTVIVYDTLDLNLNLSTFKVLGSSHPVITEISKQGVVAFHFENIMLPDSTTNKEKAQGFIRFSVEPKKDLKEGTIIKNKAGIVFDKNDPIITNTVFNTFATPVITSYRNKTEKAEFLYPNPAKDIVYIRTDKESEIFVYDFTGKLILQSNNTSIDTAGWNEGLYIFKLADSKGKIQGIEKVIITK